MYRVRTVLIAISSDEWLDPFYVTLIGQGARVTGQNSALLKILPQGLLIQSPSTVQGP